MEQAWKGPCEEAAVFAGQAGFKLELQTKTSILLSYGILAIFGLAIGPVGLALGARVGLLNHNHGD